MKSKNPKRRTATKKPLGDFSMTEVVDNISRLHEIPASKRLRRKVALALRRGVDYGILVKSGHKYRYDPETSLSIFERKASKRRRRKSWPRRMKKSQLPKEAPRAERPNVPLPTVPMPPNWTPKLRNLTTEPFARNIKRSGPKKPSL